MEDYLEKATTLVEAMPYIKEFAGAVVVIKYGGAAMINETIKASVMEDIALMKLVGMKPVIVHGGGPEINQMLDSIGKKSEFRGGLRVTDEETVNIVEMVLAGKVNKSIVQLLQKQGITAAGLCGKDGDMLMCEKNMPNGEDIGFVGKIVKVNPDLIFTMLDAGFTPVIAPIGTDDLGQSYNINADFAAVHIAKALKARKLVFLTDVSGVLHDVKDPQSFIPEMGAKTAMQYLKDGTVSGGMIPKVTCCLEAIQGGVQHVHILDGRIEHCLLLEFFTARGIGTLIINDLTKKEEAV
ncbi:acetylglutamate kinase [Bianquea renquensis]|uniref:Acetylglutamate kinase n=1 Tax=Bianquea renquensis TaxID=2763661 RepID=A0A926DVL4_9FIRM|nr:acetylglutamate kinase [Bianquea renquensis]MBC8544662.1 acetylglutamate kinase [Bianquea renquensis]